MKEVKKLLLKIVFAASAMFVLAQKDKYILKSGLPPVVKSKPEEEAKPKISLKTTLLKIGFAAASLIMLSTTSSVALNSGLTPANNTTTNTKKELKEEETLGTKMYVYGVDDVRDIPAGLIHWSGNTNESVYLSFNSLSKNFTDDHNLKSLGILNVPMFYMMDQLEPGKPPVYYVSADPRDGGKVLGPVSTGDAKIYVVRDNLTKKYFVVSYDDVKQIENNIGVRYTVVGICDRKTAMKYGCSLESTTPYRDFAQNTVVNAFLPAPDNETNKM